MSKRAGRNDETSGATRLRLLSAGADEFFEQHGRASPFRHVSLAAVARRAGVTRNGLGYHWKTKDDYCRALAAFLLGNSGGGMYEEDFGCMRAEAQGTSADDLVAGLTHLASFDLATFLANPIWIAMEALAVVFVPPDPELRALASAGYRNLDNLTWTDVYGSLASRAGREPRPPFCGETIGAVLQAIVEGAGVRGLFDHDTLGSPLPNSRDGNGSAFALAVSTLVCVLTREPGDERSVENVLDELLARRNAVGDDATKSEN